MCNVLPEMAATSAALKLGSLVREVAICSTKIWGTSGETILGFILLEWLLDLNFVRSRVTTVGAEELRDAELWVVQRLEPDVASI